MKGCLDGIRVLELGNFISGPYARCCWRISARK